MAMIDLEKIRVETDFLRGGCWGDREVGVFVERRRNVKDYAKTLEYEGMRVEGSLFVVFSMLRFEMVVVVEKSSSVVRKSR